MERNGCIDVRHLTTRFGEQLIHDDISFSIISGEVLGIVGGSGSGKSVLLKFMMGLNDSQNGKITYHKPFNSQNIGVLFQNGALISSLTVVENIMLPLTKIAHVDQDMARALALKKLRTVGLNAQDGDKSPSSLSGGMIKRAGIARALILEPPLLFLDEPTAGLDPLAANDFDDLVLRVKNHSNLTVVMITHDLDTLAKVCDRIGVLVDKKIIMCEKKDIAHVDHPWVQSYFHGERAKRLFG
ncbi:MAG: ATP-binding cassette domain-containing protein [Alphaproteobacteria bacterium]|nr:ATP-binding cassette domain-containing protein [Alphaproteobacteria bacterium]